MSLNLFGIRSAVFTESSTFSCTTLLLVKYRDSSLDLLYNLGNPYVCASTSMLCRTRIRRGRTIDDVSPAHNQASTIGASGLPHLHTYVSYCQCCEFLGDGKRQHFPAALGPDVHVSVSSTSPTRTGIVRTTSETSQRRVRLPSSAPSSPSSRAHPARLSCRSSRHVHHRRHRRCSRDDGCEPGAPASIYVEC